MALTEADGSHARGVTDDSTSTEARVVEVFVVPLKNSTGGLVLPLARVAEALEQIRLGKPVILVDDEDRENEGDIVIAAEKITPDGVNFMAKHGRGLICLTLTEARAGELDLPLMVRDNSAQFQTAFTVSIEARQGVTTGISAADRARTIQVAVDPESTSRDLARPGHIFPLI
ncbi:MAG: 3,4-dihydroxy-2-butanone-4-phosphate synthase, partial [Deltaproteobacteria bacterium]|nr:3,4-dihydroxy-2-butanone-4-phosphate synthase [Deltaproteobacteria bacterium]